MSKSRRKSVGAPDGESANVRTAGGPQAAVEPAYGNAAMAEMVAQNGPVKTGGGAAEVDDAAVARERGADFGPTGIHLRNPGSSAGMQRQALMDLLPLSTAWEGLHVQEHFHGHSVDGVGAGDLVEGSSLSDFINQLDAGHEGTFTADLAGSFVDYHGGSPVQGEAFQMLTDARKRQGFTVRLYQSYSWNGHELADTFVVSRRIAYSRPNDMTSLRMEVGKERE